MVSSTNQDVAFVAVARRGGLITEVEVPRNGCDDDAMAALLREIFGYRFYWQKIVIIGIDPHNPLT
jgi:hypothetical protein